MEDHRHIPFNLYELALDAAARGLGVAMTRLEGQDIAEQLGVRPISAAT
jgi:LysR family glycine cleavage system transcriptional activator